MSDFLFFYVDLMFYLNAKKTKFVTLKTQF